MFHIKEKKLIYLLNPKVASSSIQVSILGPDRVDGLWRDTFRSLYRAPKRFVDPIFCVTRNPYARVISGYKDKILPGKGKIWGSFSRAFRLDPAIPLDFDHFLKILCTNKKALHFDHHFAPQVANLHLSGLAPHFIGRLERMDDLQEFLSAHNISLANHVRHAKNASRDVPDLSEKQVKLIQDTYWEDFSVLGYNLDVSSSFVPPTIVQKQFVRQSFAKSHAQKVEKVLALHRERFC